MKNILVAILLVGVLLLVSACSVGNSEVKNIPLEKQCQTDTDCVRDACCHANSAVNKNYAPECGGLLCTQSCEPNTLDCGQGKIACVKGECLAIIDNPLPSGQLPS